jgi:ribosomal subunit interface protein
MIKLQLTGRKYDIDDELARYTKKRLGSLGKYLPRKYKVQQMQVEIFRDPSGKEDNRYRVKANLHLPENEIVAETATMNPHAAVDIVREKLKLQIRKYKEKHATRRFRIKELFNRAKREERKANKQTSYREQELD